MLCYELLVYYDAYLASTYHMCVCEQKNLIHLIHTFFYTACILTTTSTTTTSIPTPLSISPPCPPCLHFQSSNAVVRYYYQYTSLTSLPIY